MAIGEIKTNEQRQSLYCDIGKHTIGTGDKYLTLPSGHMSCPAHQHETTPSTNTQARRSLGNGIGDSHEG